MGSWRGGWGFTWGSLLGRVGVHMGSWRGGVEVHMGSWRGGWGFTWGPAGAGGGSHGVPAGRVGGWRFTWGPWLGRVGGFHMGSLLGRVGVHMGFCRGGWGFFHMEFP